MSARFFAELFLQNFFILQNWNSVPIKQFLLSSSFQPLATTILCCFHEFDLISLGHSYSICRFVTFILLSIMSSKFIQVVVCDGICFLLRLNNIFLYVYIIFFHPLTHQDIWVASVSWLLWIMRLWTWVYKYLFKILLSVPCDVYPEMELLEDIVVLLLIFWGMFVLISAEAISFHVTNSAQGFPFFTSSPALVFCCCFGSSHSNGCEMVSHGGFDLHFSNK